MDDLIGAMSTAQVDPKALGEHPAYSKYKNASKAAEQQANRRKDAMSRQSDARWSKLNSMRSLAGEEEEEEEEGGEGEQEEPLDLSLPAAFGSSKKDGGGGGWTKVKQPRKKNRYCGELMTSEWLMDIPEQLSTEWSLVPAPVGKRVLVVASKGVTTVYNKGGRQLNQFSSTLPGGGKGRGGLVNSYTILDGILCESASAIYCLDVLWWNGTEMVDETFDFRRFMLQSGLENVGETGNSRYSFRLLPSCACEKEAMTDFMQQTFEYELDGLLFYYNKVLYLPGQSPLVGWLKPWMLPEILGVPVPEAMMKGQSQPAASFIEDYNKKHNHESRVGKMES